MPEDGARAAVARHDEVHAVLCKKVRPPVVRDYALAVHGASEESRLEVVDLEQVRIKTQLSVASVTRFGEISPLW